MKLKLILLGAVLAPLLTNLQAITVNWQADSPDAFAVTLSGTGLSWNGDITSPSKLWELDVSHEMTYLGRSLYLDGNPVPYEVEGSHFANVLTAAGQSFGGQYVLYTGPYNTYFPAAPFITQSTWMGWITPDSPFYGWSGINFLAVTSIADKTDTSTWNWVAQYSFGRRPVPDSVNSGLCLAFALGVLFLFRVSLLPHEPRH